MLKLVAWSLGTAQAGRTLMADTPGIADDDGTVTIVLPAATDCGAAGAICTADGRMLSSRLVFTVSGP